MVLARVLVEGLRVGSRYFPKTIFAIKRADVRIHKSLYGASGGRGVRHGRDIGSLGAGLYQGTRDSGDDLDEHAVPYEKQRNGFTSGKKSKTYRRNKRSGYCRPRERYRRNQYY